MNAIQHQSLPAIYWYYANYLRTVATAEARWILMTLTFSTSHQWIFYHQIFPLKDSDEHGAIIQICKKKFQN
jgi:hypothetical protein